MLTSLLKLIRQKNDAIQNINFSIVILNNLINEYISKQPDIIHFEFEPNSSTLEKYIYGDYPYIRLFLPPFQTQISYNEIFKCLPNSYTTEDIIRTVVELIYNKIKDSP